MPVTQIAVAQDPSETMAVQPDDENHDEDEEKGPAPDTSRVDGEEIDSSSEESNWEYLDAVDGDEDGHEEDDDDHGESSDAAGPTASTSGSSASGGQPGARSSGNGTIHSASVRSPTPTKQQVFAGYLGDGDDLDAMHDDRAVNNLLNPVTRQEALASEHAEGWRRPMDDEYAALMMNGTWELVPRPKKRKGRRRFNDVGMGIGGKTKCNGDVERLKARLAIRGFLEVWLGLFGNLLSGGSHRVCKANTSHCDVLGARIQTIDFVTAFLNGELVDVIIYMEQPEGYDDGTDRTWQTLSEHLGATPMHTPLKISIGTTCGALCTCVGNGVQGEAEISSNRRILRRRPSVMPRHEQVGNGLRIAAAWQHLDVEEPWTAAREDTCSYELVACWECSKVVNNGNTSRVRHMAKHARFIKEYVQAKELDVIYVPSAENLADVFTKALGPAEFERQRDRLNVEDVKKAWEVVGATTNPGAAAQGSTNSDIECNRRNALSPKCAMHRAMHECMSNECPPWNEVGERDINDNS
ncbi:unnamed protein product [Phytophthora lilii]|uniref:Unnamed protein product n=1 Tax=Phytophthora lilii TaxID=2077276 RepID=A0A9W6TG25_9STRA|nr:unnamed protein product [Phytophthora lilii]